MMAKHFLWVLVIMGSIALFISGDDDMFARISVLSILGVLAICEAIENRRG